MNPGRANNVTLCMNYAGQCRPTTGIVRPNVCCSHAYRRAFGASFQVRRSVSVQRDLILSGLSFPPHVSGFSFPPHVVRNFFFPAPSARSPHCKLVAPAPQLCVAYACHCRFFECATARTRAVRRKAWAVKLFTMRVASELHSRESK